jgi:hypothetical protein
MVAPSPSCRPTPAVTVLKILIGYYRGEAYMRREIRIGLVFFASFIILQRFSVLPDIFLGIIMGISICSFVIGLLPPTAYNAISDFKNNLKNKINVFINK